MSPKIYIKDKIVTDFFNFDNQIISKFAKSDVFLDLLSILHLQFKIVYTIIRFLNFKYFEPLLEFNFLSIQVLFKFVTDIKFLLVYLGFVPAVISLAIILCLFQTKPFSFLKVAVEHFYGLLIVIMVVRIVRLGESHTVT